MKLTTREIKAKTMKKTSKLQEGKESKFSKLKKGEFFRFKGKKKVYIFEGGGKIRGFNYVAFDDINSYHTTKTDRIVEIGFTF